jgi:hypothetical protein
MIGVGLLFAGVALAETTAAFTLPSGVTVRIVEAPFKPSQAAERCIGGRRVPFDSTTPLPKTYVKSITVSFKGRSYALDSSCMYDAWRGRPLEVPGVIRYFGGKCFDVGHCQFRGVFSDGADSFVAEWRVVHGVAVRTVLTGSDDVVNLFIKNIDPPDFD